ncbi:MAG TPA: S8 family serine peptidase [Nitrososphaeraceae archaeon]|nr:S8 family serine peptidase [Nitrososphaeraceae archaeon]
MNFQYNFRRNFLVMITVCGIFLVIPLFGNTYADDNFEKQFLFNYFYNNQNIDNRYLESNNIIPNQFIIYLQDNKEENNSIDPVEFYNAELKDTGTELLYVYYNVVKGLAIKIPNEKVLEQLKNNPLVEYMGNDRKISAFIDTHIENQIIPESVDRVDGESLNTIGINSNFVDADIAILDTGIDLDHADLNVFHERSFIPGTINADDDHGHGTHLSGVAAAKDNSFGIVGIAPGARLWAIKVLESSGMGEISTLIKGLDYINQNQNQVDVAVLSLGCECESGALDIAINNSIKAGITIVVAAGNEGKDAGTFTPANNPEVITVSAIADTDGKCGGKGPSTPYGADDMLASFSNYGDVVDISAPGVDIYSTFKSNSYTKLTGTSMAAPHVAGAAALYISLHPEASPNDVKSYLITSGTNFSDLCDGNGHGYFVGDKDNFHEPLLYIGTNKINSFNLVEQY